MITKEFQTKLSPTPKQEGDIGTKEYADGTLAKRFRINFKDLLDKIYPIGAVVISKVKPTVGEWSEAHPTGYSYALGSGDSFGKGSNGKINNHFHNLIYKIRNEKKTADDEDVKLIGSYSGHDKNGNVVWATLPDNNSGNITFASDRLYTPIDERFVVSSVDHETHYSSLSYGNYACSVNFTNNTDEGIKIWKRTA